MLSIKRLFSLLLVMMLVVSITACGTKVDNVVEATEHNENAETVSAGRTIEVQILATSDIHGKFVPYDYALNTESSSGSLAQVATFINEVRNDNTLVIDCGDLIQGNSAELFHQDDIHPLIEAMNLIGYDAMISGNHEFNFGVDTLKHVVSKLNGTFLCGNVYNPDGTLLGQNYIIKEIDGLKIAIIGMVTPNIVRWDEQNLQGYVVTNPVEETRKIIDEIQNEVDIIIAAEHMGENNEYDVAGSGVLDLADSCPEIDLIIAGHDHKQIYDLVQNDVLIVENANEGQSVAQIKLTVQVDTAGNATVVNREAASVSMEEYTPSQEIIDATKEAHDRAVENAEVVIGQLVNGPLAPENEINGVPQARLQPTALINLVNEVQMHYTGADVSASALFIDDANLDSGDVRNCDMVQIYKYTNTLYKMELNGAQLKRYMEWSASYYNQYQEGDLTISFSPTTRGYNYDMFYGVNYKINVAKPVGERIEDLTWPDGTPVKDDDVFILAVNNYRSSTVLNTYGEIFQEGEELPKLLEIDVRGDLGGVREIIADYIKNVKNGVIDANEYYGLSSWEIIGNDWDDELHAKAVQLINEGKIAIKNTENNRQVNIEAITIEDVNSVS